MNLSSKDHIQNLLYASLGAIYKVVFYFLETQTWPNSDTKL